MKIINEIWRKVNTPENIVTMLSQGINVVISLIAGKLISLLVQPTVFGEYNLQFGIIILISSLMISPAIQFYKVKVADINVISVKTFNFFRGYSFSIAVLASLVLYLFSYFNIGSFSILTLFLTALYLFFNTNVSLDTDFLNIRGRLKTLAKINILRQTIYIIILVTALFSFKFKSLHLWLVIVSSLVLISFFSRRSVLSILKNNIIDNINPKKIKPGEFLAYSAPLILMSFASWLNGFSDRYILNHFLNESAVGQYNAAYGLGSKIFGMINPVFLIILTPKIYGAITEIGGEKKVNVIIRNSIVAYMVLGLPIIIFIFAFFRKIGYLLLSLSYSEGFIAIPWISLGYFFLTMTYIINIKFYAFGKTNWILIITIVSAIINLSLNVLFIPKLGILGGGLSTSISFFIGFIISLFLLHKTKHE